MKPYIEVFTVDLIYLGFDIVDCLPTERCIRLGLETNGLQLVCEMRLVAEYAPLNGVALRYGNPFGIDTEEIEVSAEVEYVERLLILPI